MSCQPRRSSLTFATVVTSTVLPGNTQWRTGNPSRVTAMPTTICGASLPILAVPALPRCGVGLLAGRLAAADVAILVATVLVVVYVEIEQVGHPVEDGLLDGVLVRFQEVHGAIELVQFQGLRPVDMRVFLEPLFMAVEFRGRGTGAVGNQCKQCALGIKSELPRTGLLSNHGVDAQLLPERFEDIWVTIGPGADQAPVAAGADNLFRRASAQDALGQAAQPLDNVRIVGAPTVMNDARL